MIVAVFLAPAGIPLAIIGLRLESQRRFGRPLIAARPTRNTADFVGTGIDLIDPWLN